MNLSIKIDSLSKVYTLGGLQQGNQNFQEAMVDTALAPLRWVKDAATGRKHPQPEQIWALKDVSFEIQAGEVVGIIGRNGAGKTTLLKILAKITMPTAGRAEIRGRMGSLLEVGTGFHSELTGRENIYLNGSIFGMKKAEIDRKFDEIVAFAETERFLDTPVKRYSSGMYVRLAFAVAAHLEPEILLVDEMLAVGDAQFQRKCLDKMEDIGHQGRTILFDSHNIPAVTRLCHRAILLDQGKMVQDGPSPEVAANYLQPGTGTTALREWREMEGAPGNDIARIRSICVRDERGRITDALDIRESLKLEIEYDNFPNKRFPYASIAVYNGGGICLFSSGDFNNREWRHQSRMLAGRVKSTCIIPGNYLSEGRVSVWVALMTHNPDEIFGLVRDAVSFLIVDRSQGDGVRGEYAGDFPGVIRPYLNWDVHCRPEFPGEGPK
jgi:lipopolysaccharide transport system ATP-binding protein